MRGRRPFHPHRSPRKPVRLEVSTLKMKRTRRRGRRTGGTRQKRTMPRIWGNTLKRSQKPFSLRPRLIPVRSSSARRCSTGMKAIWVQR